MHVMPPQLSSPGLQLTSTIANKTGQTSRNAALKYSHSRYILLYFAVLVMYQHILLHHKLYAFLHPAALHMPSVALEIAGA
jgi:hypothetical protein